MLRLLLTLLLACAVRVQAAAPDDTAAVRRLIDAGAVEVALARIEALQPREVVAASWAEWEGLRCEVLSRLRRHAELLARLNTLPAGAGVAPLNACFLHASRAALGQNDPQLSRALAARLLWQRTATPSEAKAVRSMVIESYISERRGEDAFRSMLRFQQDYQPLDRSVAERFAEALLDLGQDREALNWLGADDLSPARLRLQLRGATLSAEAVIRQARAAFARNPDRGYWRAIHEAAVRSGNGALQIEALEHLLQSADARDEAALSGAAQRLWQAYFDIASEIGNREQLLVGDDGAWADYAARRLGSEPFASRAFYGFLAQSARTADIRRNAQLQLAYSLSSSGLDYTALRLVRRAGFEAEALDAQTRQLLGTVAAKRNEAALALELWNGVPAPVNVNAIEWQLTLARTALQAGDAEASANTMKQLLSGRPAVSPELAQSALELGQEMLDLRKLDAAQTVYELLVPVSDDSRAREALFGLGRAQELKGDAVAAAGSYLASALLAQGAAPDALAFQARLLAALNLMRAGLRDDARAQFGWLLKNSKDPALTEAARRGLNRL